MTIIEPRLTIAIPTYNGARSLHDCLANVAAQTHREFKALVLDNASTDATATIAQTFAANDSRFTYIRRNTNVQAVINFMDGLRRARSPLFMWRADDDVWAPNYLEELIAIHNRNTSCGLAVGTIVSERTDGTARKVIEFPAFGDNDIASMRRLLRSSPSWVYGMFKRAAILPVMETVLTEYDETWAADQLILFNFGLLNAIEGTNNTYFIQRVLVQPSEQNGASAHRWKQKRNALEQTEFFASCRHRFTRIASRWISGTPFGPARRLLWRMFLWHYLAIKLFPARKIWRRRFKYNVLRVTLK